ncbi:hypothetical protein HDU93_007119 [Gonapodya sp. JEL0774]|nr:hypothetical protein HDU93_007119 [Gonapodya sp. JEL0774]
MSKAAKFDPSIGVIGAGMSGIVVGVQAQKQLKSRNFTIYEKETGVGGTWWVNRYPDWSTTHSPGDEIQRYCENVAKKYNLLERIRFGHQLVEARWLEEQGMWELHFLVHDTVNTPPHAPTRTTSRHHFLVFGGGGLHYPKLPSYPGWERFSGVIAHSGNWPKKDVDVAGKDVAVIGTGASGVQIVETIAPSVGKLTVYQRTPGYHPPKDMRRFSWLTKFLFRHVPGLTLFYRILIFLSADLSFPFLLTGSFMNRFVSRMILNYYKKEIADERLRKALTPSYDVGTKRILPQVTYLKDLQRPNVELVYDEAIVEVDEKGIWTESKKGAVNGVANGQGNGHEVGPQKKHRNHDVIIAATGFEVSFGASPVKIYGRGGIERGDKWFQLTGEKDLAMTYKTAMTSGFPNFFMSLGPNSGIGHISAVYMIEVQVDYALAVIKECIRRNLKVVDPKEEKQIEFTQRIWKDLQKTYNPTGRTDGKISTMYPYSATSLYLDLRSVDLRDFNLVGRDGKEVVVTQGPWSVWTYAAVAAAVVGGAVVAGGKWSGRA